MASNQNQFHIFFLPFMAPGHMLPTIDMARLFATRGVNSTIVTTLANEALIAKTMDIEPEKPNKKIKILTMKFPYDAAGVPEGCDSCENADFLTSTEMFLNFFKAIDLLQHPFTSLLLENYKPNCIVADSFFHWANTIAIKFQIPCLSFHGSSYFSQCISYNLLLLGYEPNTNPSSDSEALIIIPGDLPHEIKLVKSELSPYDKNEGPKFLLELMDKINKAKKECHGVIMNSFYELEPDYADYYGKVMGIKHWHIGPFFLGFSQGGKGADHRGKSSSIDVSECRRWLDEKQIDSVIYICLGSMSNVTDSQLHEIAIALEDLGQNFILVVRKEDTNDWTPNGFEARIKGRGLIIRGWAPQPMILDHQSVGGFVTHCGWNSILEGVVLGVPMVTWPLHAEQFYNEKLVTNVLKIGIEVGTKQWVPRMGNHNILVSNKDILKAMTRLMMGDEAHDIRERAKKCKEMAKMSMSEGGSSWSDLNALIQELKVHKYYLNL